MTVILASAAVKYSYRRGFKDTGVWMACLWSECALRIVEVMQSLERRELLERQN